MWSNKYIGIPFRANGRDYSGVDCWGLVRLVYKEQYDIDLPSFEQDYIVQDNKRIVELVSQYKEGWEQLETPSAGCIVLFRILGRATHVGVMVNDTEFLHSREGYDVAIGSVFATRWTNRVVGFYKYVDKTKTHLEQLPVALQAETVPFTIDKPTKLVAAVNKLAELSNLEKENLVVLVNNAQIPKMYWDQLELQHTDVVSYRVVPQGGDTGQIFKMVALVVLAYYAPMIAAEYGIAGAATTTTFMPSGAVIAGFNSAAYAVGGAITIAGTYALNSIFPVRDPVGPQDPGSTEAQYMVEGGGNRAVPYSAIPVVLGKIRLTPPLAGQNFVTYPEERVTYLTTAVAWGFGPLTITDVKIGENPISQYVLKQDSNGNPETATVTGVDSPEQSLQAVKFNELYNRDVYQPPWQPYTLICEGNPEGTTSGGEITGYDAEGNPVLSPTVTVNPNPGPWTPPISASTDTVNEVAVAFHMPQGMRKIKARGDGAGESFDTAVTIELEYSTNNGQTWLPWEIFTISGGGAPKKDAFTIVKRKTFPTETSGVTLRARRLTGDNTEDNPDWRYLFGVQVLSITYLSSRQPILPPPNCTLARSVWTIKATEQINGQLEGVNAVVQSICRLPLPLPTPIYEPTSNPAALFLHVLMHPANPQRILESELNDRVNMEQINYWYNYCNSDPGTSSPRTITFQDVNAGNQTIGKTYKYEYNGVVADKRSVLEVLRDICAAGRASPTIIDGKWTVTIDEPKTAITQHFSSHNSWGFEAVRALPKLPDALKITFYNEEQNYQQTETIVYNSGKNYGNSTLFESITLPGVTNLGAVIDHGKWHFAQAKLRREAYTLNCDIEYLSCNRGDRVKVTHDVPAWGSGSGRITDIYRSPQGIATVVKISESVYTDRTKFYNLRLRSKTGSSTVFGTLNNLLFSGFTRSGSNTITIQFDTATVPTIPFDSTDTITITCSAFPGINITNQKVTVNRQNNTISYTTQTTVGSPGFNSAIGTVGLTGEYEYLLINSVVSSTDRSGNTQSVTAPIPTNILDVGDLFLFGEINKESQDLIVLSIEPGENKTARLTLVDYGVTSTYNIFNDYKTLTENVIFNTNITLPPKKLINSFNGYIVPYVTAVYSDDNAVEILSPGTYRYNIKISYATVSKDLPVNTKYVECQYRLNSGVNPEENIKTILSDYNSNTITIPDVVLGEQYRFRLRYLTADGVAGPWPVSTTEALGGWSTHAVVGFEKNAEVIQTLTVTRVGKFLRIVMGPQKPDNFKEFKIKIYKSIQQATDTISVNDWWINTTNPDIKTYTSSNNILEVNLLDFQVPRIYYDGMYYNIACVLVDVAGNESTAIKSAFYKLYPISP